MAGFKKWLLNEVEATSGKTGLYPLGYGGISLYPSLYFIPISGDAITYISQDERLYNNGEGSPFNIKHIGGRPSWPPTKNPNNGDNPPFNLNKIKK